jgi:hypothetical protein
LIAEGPAVDVCDQYDSFMRQKADIGGAVQQVAAEPSGQLSTSEQGLNGDERLAASLVSGSLIDDKGSPCTLFLIGGELRLVITYDVHLPNDGLVVGAAIFRNDDIYVTGLNTRLDRFEVANEPGRHTVTLRIPHLSLLGGDYYFKAGVFDPLARVRWDFSHQFASFKVAGPYVAEGVMVPPHDWIKGEESPQLVNTVNGASL